MAIELNSIVATVQYNCDVADARHGADYGLCTYLMKMREYFRWEHGLGFAAGLDKERVGAWLTEREERWDAVAEAEFRPIPIAGADIDPFEVATINAALRPLGRVYSAGLAQGGRPQFFLADLEASREDADGFHVHLSGREWARGLSAAPALSLGRDIYVRRQSLRQYLWEKYESWTWSRPDNAYARALGEYGLETDLENELERMTEAQIPVLLAHEIGEYRAGRMLGAAWERMLGDLLFTPAELVARAVRDNLADSLETLDLLAGADGEASLHLYVGALSNMRKALWPGLLQAYAAGNDAALAAAARVGRGHWETVARELLQLHAGDPETAAERIAARRDSIGLDA